MGPHRWRYQLAPTDDGTGRSLVTETWDVSAYPSLLRKLLAKSFHATAQRSIEGTLVRLKDAAEADQRTAPGDQPAS